MANRGEYTVYAENQNIATAITILQLTAPSVAVLLIRRAWVQVSGGTASTTAAKCIMQLLRKTATATGTASPPSIRPLGGDQAAGSTSLWKATAEGTDGNVLDGQAFDVLSSGYLWAPADVDDYIVVPPSGIIALKFPTAPAANLNFNFGFDFREVG